MFRLHDSTETLQCSRAVLQLSVRADGACSSGRLEPHDLLPLVQGLGDYVWGTIESTLDSTRHNVKNTLARILSMVSVLRGDGADVQGSFLRSLLGLGWRSRAKYSALSVAMRHRDTRGRILEEDPGLPAAILASLGQDPTLSVHCSELYKLCLRECRKDSSEEEPWLEVWVRPLLEEVDLGHTTSAERVRAVLEVALGLDESAVDFVARELSSRSRLSEQSLMALLATLRVKKRKAAGWKGYLQLTAFKRAQNHYLDKVRLEAFSTIITSRSSAELYSEEEFKEILKAAQNNMKLEETADRQDFLTLFKKMLCRLSEGLASRSLDKESPEEYRYASFLSRLESCLSDQLFPDACTSRRICSLECMRLLTEIVPAVGPATSICSVLLPILDDGYARSRALA